MSKTVKHKLEYGLTAFFAWWFRILPAPVSVAAGMSLGWIGYRIIGIRRKVMRENLRQAFPDKSDSELDKIALKSYCHWAGMTAEFAILPRMNRKYLEKYVDFRDVEVLDRAVEKGKGGLVISGHLGNWEVMGAAATEHGYKVTYVVATQSNKKVDKLMDNYRRVHNIQIYKTREAPRGILKAVRDNRFTALMIDQDAGRECVFVDFFGKAAATPRGPAVFHLKTGSPLIMSSCLRIKGPHYRINFKEINLTIPEGTIEQKTTYIMAELTKLLEEQVRQHPEQYFWMHKRWKTRPVGNLSSFN